MASTYAIPAYLLALLVGAIVARVIFVYTWTGRSPWRQGRKRSTQDTVRTLIVLGSGGHTAEMLSLIKALNFERHSPRCYIAGATDNLSLSKAVTLEEEACISYVKGSSGGEIAKGAGKSENPPQFLKVYRSREVGQSYITSVGTTLVACVHAFVLVFRFRPDMILCNGPGTCLPICVAGFLLKLSGLRWVTMIFVESICRVEKLSLTGQLLYRCRLMDQFYVQWDKLQHKYSGTVYIGRLM